MVKVVENDERICTVNLDGSECSIVFQSNYKCFAVKNESDSEVYISLKRNITPEEDGVMSIGSKESSSLAHFKPNVNMFFTKGTGKIQVFASNSDNIINPFKSAPVAVSDGGGDSTLTWTTSLTKDPYDFIKNVFDTSQYCGAGYSSVSEEYITKLVLQQSWKGYNLTHSYGIDLSNVTKIILYGSLKTNMSNLSATAYFNVSNEDLTTITDDWKEVCQTTGSDVSDFTYEFDCKDISGEHYIYIGVKHGEEVFSNTVYLNVYKIEFIYGAEGLSNEVSFSALATNVLVEEIEI